MKHPLEIVLRETGTVELLDGNDDIVWSSDADADFKDEVSNELLVEDDMDDVLAYLEDHHIINEYEISKFEDGSWDVISEGDDESPAPDVEDDDEDSEDYDESDEDD